MTAPSPLLAASTERLVRELRRHIGAHADIVANDLIESGAVVPVASLADVWDEGYQAGSDAQVSAYWDSKPTIETNPYRAAALEDR